MESQLRESFAEFIIETRYENLPPEVIHQAKRCLLDFIGVALGGCETGLAPMMTELICGLRGVEEASVIGANKKIPALHAALVNGVRGHALDMDDGHRYANAHPAVAVIPAAIAIAERENATGKELIEAIVVGYETFIRIARAINPSHIQRGFHTTGTVGPFGAAAACSKLLRLSAYQVANALSIAGLQAGGLLEVTASGEMIKPLHPGKAAQAGVLAALLAKDGAEGPRLIFEGEKGFFRAFSDGTEGVDVACGLGQTYETLNTYFKLYAACRHIHPSLDAVKEIMDHHNVDIDDIESINVETYSVAFRLTGENKKEITGIGAKFHLPVSIGLMLVYGQAGMDSYSEEKVNNHSVKTLAEKVRITIDPEMDEEYPKKRSGTVEIKTSKNRYFHRTDVPKGEPENPCSDADLEKKFFQAAANCFSREEAESAHRAILGIENISVNDLMQKLEKNKRA